ncbi:LysR family transcriptional regulator [Patulibacter defluvii]|uniref:LysR family transcriptional regulator n=1 Tax=Patulibacter defluvii TaxID=3095358 RepID=UPI002A754CD5|nr:LysR family transcriptional regulator [Patulibacter sp. DM4]
MQGRQLEYLVALDRERHFGRAADACHVTQPTLSAGIRALETALGVPLVRRGHRFEGLTPEGERVLRWAQRIVADHRNLAADAARMRGDGVGVLRIGAIPTALPVIARLTSPFLERHPATRIEVRSMTSREIERGLDTFGLDVGVTYLADDPPEGVRTWPLYRERYRLVTAADGPFAGRDAVGWSELDGVRLCLLTADMQNRRILDGRFAAAGATPDVALETNSLTALLGHVRAGWSSVVAHPWTAAFGLPAGMRALPLVAPDDPETIGLLAAAGDPAPPSVATLVELAATIDLDRPAEPGR